MMTMTSPRRTSMETSREDRAGVGKIVARTGDAISGLVIVAILPTSLRGTPTPSHPHDFLAELACVCFGRAWALAVISQTEVRRRHERKKLTKEGGLRRPKCYPNRLSCSRLLAALRLNLDIDVD